MRKQPFLAILGRRVLALLLGLTLVSPALASDVHALIEREASYWNVDAALVKAVVAVESGFYSEARSPKGAIGLMQLMPETVRRFGVEDPLDPQQNIVGGIRYLRFLLDRFDGDLHLALAGYNAGENAVVRYGGIPPYPETRDYVERVLHCLQHDDPGGVCAPRVSGRHSVSAALIFPRLHTSGGPCWHGHPCGFSATETQLMMSQYLLRKREARLKRCPTCLDEE